MLETVNADADRVTRLITELLDVARIESGRLHDAPAGGRPRRGREARKVIAGGSRRGAAERFARARSGELPEMWLDADKLDQIIGNLLENAVRHGAGRSRSVGGVRPTRREWSRAVTVTDEGEGIPPELHDRVFTRFWRARPSRRHRARPLHRARASSRRTAARSRCGRAPTAAALVPIRAARRHARLRRASLEPPAGYPPAYGRHERRTYAPIDSAGAHRLRVDHAMEPDVRTQQVLRPRAGDAVERRRGRARPRRGACRDREGRRPGRAQGCAARRTPATARRSPWPTGRSARCRPAARAEAGKRVGLARRAVAEALAARQAELERSATSACSSRRPSTSPCPGTARRAAPGTR